MGKRRARKITKAIVARALRPHIAPARGFELLKLDVEANKPQPDTPQHLDAKLIKRMIGVFQPRELMGRLLEDEGHLETLTRAIGTASTPHYLDPMVVWWSGQRWMLIDGHHRLEAYKRAGVLENLPVTVFHGTLEEAMQESVRLNSKDKMPMTLNDKLNRAWRMVCLTQLSINEIATSCAVGTTTISTMRKTKRALDAKGRDGPLADLTWLQAKTENNGGGAASLDLDQIKIKRIEEMAQRLRKTLGSIAAIRDIEILASALKALRDDLPAMLMGSEAWELSRDALLEDYMVKIEDKALRPLAAE